MDCVLSCLLGSSRIDPRRARSLIGAERAATGSGAQLTAQTHDGSLTAIWHVHPGVLGYDETRRIMGDAE